MNILLMGWDFPPQPPQYRIIKILLMKNQGNFIDCMHIGRFKHMLCFYIAEETQFLL